MSQNNIFRLVPVQPNERRPEKPQIEPWGGFFPSDSIARPKERSWFVQDLIPCNELVYLTGDPGSAKSKLLLQLQITAALGNRQWIGKDVPQAKCLGLYLGEDNKEEQERRCWDVCDALETDVSCLNDQLELNPRQISKQWLSTKLVDADLQWTRFGEDLWRIVSEAGYRVVVIDTATKALGWLGRRDGNWIESLVFMFREKCEEHNCSVIITDHTTKSDRKGFAGVQPLLGAVRAAMNIYIPNDDKAHKPMKSKRILHELRTSYSAWEPIHLKWENNILIPDDDTTGISVNGIVFIPGERGVETHKGIQFYDGTRTVWLPKAQIEYDIENHRMAMPCWLAKESGLID